jgi:hypothetical protein
MNISTPPTGHLSSLAASASPLSSSIVLPWEYDCALPSSDSDSKGSAGAHPFAAFIGSDDNLFSGLHASVSKALRSIFLSPNPADQQPLRETLIQWSQSTTSERQVAEVVDAFLSISHEDISPLSAAVHSFMTYASLSKSLSDIERRLCVHLKGELYCNFSVLSLSPGALPVFPTDSAGNIPCVRLIGMEFSSLKRLDHPRILLIYCRSYLHIHDSSENFTFIDVYDTVSCKVEPLLKTCSITGFILSASIDFNLKVLVCVAASECSIGVNDVMPSQESGSNDNHVALSADASAAYWLHQSAAVAAVVQSNSECSVENATNTQEQQQQQQQQPDQNDTDLSQAKSFHHPSLRVDVTNSSHGAVGSEKPTLGQSSPARYPTYQHLDYRTFVWSFRNVESKAISPLQAFDTHSPYAGSDNLQLEWYDDECLFPKTCNVVAIENAAPILLRFRQEEFVQVGKVGSRVEKLLRVASDKEIRESVRLSLPSLLLDQLFLDKPPPNRVRLHPTCPCAHSH